MKKVHPDYDTHWKELIEKLFWSALAFFLPKIYAIADQSKGVEFLDKELHKLIADKFKGGNTRKDKLAKICLKNGKAHYILIHFEVQVKFEKGFLRRMFVYFYRIFDKREENITALAIYTGESVPEDCDKFEYEFMGTKVLYQFNAFRVCEADEAMLLKDDSPMALAILAAKYLNQTKNNKELRYRYKLKLIELTRKRGWTKQEVAALLQFIDLMIILPKPMEIEFREEVLTKYDSMSTTTTPKSEIAEFFIKYYDAMEARFKEIVREDFGEQIEQEVRQEITEQIQQEVKQEVRQEITEQIQQEVKQEVRQKIEEQIQQEIKQKVLQEAKIEGAKNLLLKTDLTPQQVADIQGISLEIVLKLQTDISGT